MEPPRVDQKRRFGENRIVAFPRSPGGTTMATAEALLTAEEFGRRPDPGYPEELVQGRIIAMPPPQPRHGQVCAKVIPDSGSPCRRTRPWPRSQQRFRRHHRSATPIRFAVPTYPFTAYERLPKGPIPGGLPCLPAQSHRRGLLARRSLARDSQEGSMSTWRLALRSLIVLDPEPRHGPHLSRRPRTAASSDRTTI